MFYVLKKFIKYDLIKQMNKKWRKILWKKYLKKIFEKHETLFCILLIAAYVVENSYCLQNFGILDYRTTIVNTIFSAFLIVLMIILRRTKYYGLTKVENPKKYLYFIPLIIIISINLWNGINIKNTKEEIIFRGFLFKMMEKDNVKSAIIVSSITFGIGHIVNLLNGADLIPTLIQICYAISLGYLFVIIFYKSKSLIPCIITHQLINSLSIFNIETKSSLYIGAFFFTIIPLVYAFYINKTIKE